MNVYFRSICFLGMAGACWANELNQQKESVITPETCAYVLRASKLSHDSSDSDMDKTYATLDKFFSRPLLKLI